MTKISSGILDQLVRRRDSTPAASGEPGTPATPRYRLDGEIARGGMGAIMKVWDTDLRRALAMKVILGADRAAADGSPATARLDRFLEEAQITGQLDHPGVVPVHELGIDGEGRVFFTMRLVRGLEYDKVIELARGERDGWTRMRALHTLLRVCETMAFAHAKGVVHRDLKPENVMVGQFGETYVMDWGLARVLGQPDSEAQRRRILGAISASIVRTERQDAGSDGLALTEDGTVMGTPYYMPPEQAAGKLEDIGPQSDVYAVGAMLYHLLTGKRPYEELHGQPAVTVVRAVLEGPPTEVHRLDRTVPPELVAICMRAMARSPDQRYPDMIAMAKDLRAYLEFRVVRAYKTGALIEFRKWISRNRTASASLAALLVVALGALGIFGWMQRQNAIRFAAAQEQTKLAHDAAVRNLDLALQRGYVAHVTAASACLAAGEIIEAKRHLTECPDELRGFEWQHLSLRADSSLAALTGHTGAVTDLEFDSRGVNLVSGGADGTVHIWNLEARRSLHRLATGAGDNSGCAVAFIGGGRQVAAFGRRRSSQMQVWDVATGNLVSRLPLEPRALYAIAVAPDGSRVALGAPDNAVYLFATDTGSVLGALAGHRATVRSLAFSDDGQKLASGAEDRTVLVWNVAERSLLATSGETAATVHSLAFAPGSTEVVAGLEDGAINRLDPATGALRSQLLGHQGAVYALAFDAGGRWLASAAFDKTVRQWSVEGGEAVAVLLGHDQPVRSLAWSADGTTIASGSEDATIRLWDATHRGAVGVYRGSEDYLSGVDISADGSRIVIGSSWPGVIDVVDAETLLVDRRVVSGPQDSISGLAYAPSGGRFAVALEEECSVRLFDPDTGEFGAPLLGHEASVTAIAFSPDGERLASASSDQTVWLWNVANGTARGAPIRHDAPLADVAFAPDGRRLATGARDGSARVFAADGGATLVTIAGDGPPVHAVAFSPDGTMLAIGRGDGRVQLVRAETGESLAFLVGHDQSVSSLAFSPDGTRLATGSFDGTVRVWETATARPVLTLRGHTAQVTDVAWSRTGSTIASTAHDGTLRVWQTRRER